MENPASFVAEARGAVHVSVYRRGRGEPSTRQPSRSGSYTRADDMDDRLYFRQLLTGRDVARTDPVARQMLNFVYLIGDRETGEAVAVDPAYAPGEVLDLLAADGMRLTGVLATHYHPDHVGGDMMGFSIAGIGRAAGAGRRAHPRAARRGPLRQRRHRRDRRPRRATTAATP